MMEAAINRKDLVVGFKFCLYGEDMVLLTTFTSEYPILRFCPVATCCQDNPDEADIECMSYRTFAALVMDGDISRTFDDEVIDADGYPDDPTMQFTEKEVDPDGIPACSFQEENIVEDDAIAGFFHQVS